jgi:hypothetical protein
MEKAIKKAIEGGLEIAIIKSNPKITKEGVDMVVEQMAKSHKDFLLNPLFWKALGKACGWFYPDGRSVAKYINNDPKRTQKDLWLWHWHRFIDHLAEGKDEESFFNELLK